MPGSPSASWALYKARVASIFQSADASVLTAFWLFGTSPLRLPLLTICQVTNHFEGLINNVLFVIILSAAQDVVGSDVPKGLVLLADILPAFTTKLIAPYFIHSVPYSIRIIFFAVISSAGMLMIAFTPPDKSVSVKLVGVMFASLASGGGELSFLGLTHYYGHMSLAAWGSGTGAAGLLGAGLYVLLTDWLGLSLKTSLLASASLPVLMLVSFFVILPRGPLRDASKPREYEPILDMDDAGLESIDRISTVNAASSLLAPGPGVASAALSTHDADSWSRVRANFRRAKSLFFPFMLPLLLVYVAEYIINQGVSPTCK
jgi:battenin